jgi:hypothetical protein
MDPEDMKSIVEGADEDDTEVAAEAGVRAEVGTGTRGEGLGGVGRTGPGPGVEDEGMRSA